MKKYKNLVLLLLVLLTVMLLLNYFEPVLGKTITGILTSFTTLVGVFSVFYEMKRSADIEECNFVLTLFERFTSNDTNGISIMYDKLDLLFSTGENTITKSDRKHMVKYLEFLEMIVSLVEKDVLSIPDIDRLFGYWFFIAVNCKDVQNIELIPSRDYYEGIYSIYPKWIKYRRSQNRPIPFEENLLIK